MHGSFEANDPVACGLSMSVNLCLLYLPAPQAATTPVPTSC
jgi:hypothetical protein